MDSAHSTLERMNLLLDKLIHNAIQLRDLSKQVIAEAELIPLQKTQENLLQQIEEIDQKIQQEFASEISHEDHDRIHAKLTKFLELNQEFVSNLKTSHGLIQFDLNRFNEESLEDAGGLPPVKFPKIHPEKKETKKSKKK